MALQYSTGFKDAVLDTGSFKGTFDDGYIRIYDGTMPADADAALAGNTVLVTYSDNDAGFGVAGLDLEAAAVNGAISKATAQTWKGTAAATSAGTFFRYIQAADTGGASATEIRIQGTVGGAGADLFLSTADFVSTNEYTLDLFSISIP